MWNVRIIFILIILILVIAFVITFSYKAIYTKKSNERIQSGNYNRKPMHGLPKVFIMTVMASIIAIVLLLAFSSNSKSTITYSYNSYKEVPYDEIDESYAGEYDIDSNIGYDRFEKTVGDINFIYFVSKAENDVYHPTFICFVNYTGDLENIAYGCNGEYSFLESEENSTSFGFGGGNAEKTKLFIGSIDEGYSFELKIYYYDQLVSEKIIGYDDKTSKIEKYATAVGSVVIDLE